MKRLLARTLPLSAALVPIAAFAQTLSNVQTLVQSAGQVINLLLPIAVAVALLVFFWGLIKYLQNVGNEEARKEGKSLMAYGVIALFVMVSVWGLVGFIGRALNVGQGGSAPVPGVNSTPGGSGSLYGY